MNCIFCNQELILRDGYKCIKCVCDFSIWDEKIEFIAYYLNKDCKRVFNPKKIKYMVKSFYKYIDFISNNNSFSVETKGIINPKEIEDYVSRLLKLRLFL
jgi:hypothetical protein